MRFPLLPSLVLTLLPLLAAQAQSTATGRVVAQATGKPLPQTTVRLDGQPEGVSTDEAGRFSLPLVGAGSAARLIFSHLGYQSQAVPVGQLGSEVKLVELSYQIGEVLVTHVSLRKLLVRKWRIDEGSLDAVRQLLLASAQKNNPARAAKLTRRPGAVRSALKTARYLVHDDGTVKARMLFLGSAGEWKLNEQDRTLRVSNDQGDQVLLNVIELSDSRLVLEPPGTGAPLLVYVPAD